MLHLVNKYKEVFYLLWIWEVVVENKGLIISVATRIIWLNPQSSRGRKLVTPHFNVILVLFYACKCIIIVYKSLVKAKAL